MVKKTDIIVVIVLGVFIVSLGVIGLHTLHTTGATTKDNLYDGQKLEYTISMGLTDQPVSELKNLEIVVDKADLEKKILSYSMTSDKKKTSGNSFTVIKTNNDTTVKINSNIPIIQEIQPEIPNLLPLPENFYDPDLHWKRDFNQSGTYQANNGVVEYYIIGTSNFTNIGQKTITTKAGSFNCVGIQQDVNYSIKESIISSNGTTTEFEKTGYFNGENWFDQKSKVLVSSLFDNHKVTSADMSEANKGIYGYEKMYREIPVDVHMTTELTKISEK